MLKQLQPEKRGVRICKNNPADTKVRGEGEAGDVPGARAACGEDHGEAAVPLQHRGVHGETASGGPHFFSGFMQYLEGSAFVS